MTMYHQRVPTEEDIAEELRPVAQGLDHDPSSVNSDRSPHSGPRTLSSQLPQHVDFFEKLTYHNVSKEELCGLLDTDANRGLSNVAVAHNIRRDGRNTITKKGPGYMRTIVTYLFSAFPGSLWFAAALSLNSWKGGVNSPAMHTYLAFSIFLIAVIFSHASFSALQDWHANRMMNTLLKDAPSRCTVIREGEVREIHIADVVTGDIVKLDTGNKVPADMRLIETSDDLRFDRSMLTDKGESEEIEGVVDSRGASFLEAPNIAFMGTHVINGNAKGVVVLTGDRTLIGHISKLKNKTKTKPTLVEHEIKRFVPIIVFLNFALWLGIYKQNAGRHRDQDFWKIFSQSIPSFMTCLIAFIPAGIPVAVTLTQTFIIRRMNEVAVLPKSLPAVDTLGCVTVICSDKTGTLTENKMSVMSVGSVDKAYATQEFHENFAAEAAEGKSAIHKFYRAAVLCNSAKFAKIKPLFLTDRVINGDATDSAILRFTTSLGDASAIHNSHPEIYQIPFNSHNKWMLTMHNYRSAENSPSLIFVKGAPDVLIPKCSFYLSALTNDIQPFDSVAREKLITTQENWSRSGQRVILLCMREYNPCHAVGTKDFSAEIRQKGIEALTIVGILGLMDPLRPKSADTVKDCRKAGVRFFMVTGDFRTTAVSIAQEVGIITTHSEPDSLADVVEQVQDMPSGPLPSWWDPTNRIKKSLVLEGKDLLQFTDNHWNIATRYEEIVFARTIPEQKSDIVAKFKKRDNVVAVVGDGANDAPALRAADIGIAVVSGSDVAVDAADLVLLGSFGSIIGGIRLGRLTFQNLQKVITYLLPAGNWSQIWTVILTVYLGLPVPLSPFLMIIICCFTDLLPGLSLIVEKEEFDLLTVPPRNHKKDHLFSMKVYTQTFLFIGMMETFIAYAMFFSYYSRYAGFPVRAFFPIFEEYNNFKGYLNYTVPELIKFFTTAQCVYFVTLVILQWGNLLSVRNKRLSILQADPIRKERRNAWPLLGVPLATIIAILVTELPVIQRWFSTAPVPLEFWLIPLPLSLSILIMDEIRKLLVRRYPNSFLARIAW